MITPQQRELQRGYVARITARNRRIVARELAARGGHCVHPGCTATKVEWHHRDPATKTNGISEMTRGSVERLERELDLCDPLCRKHHLEIDGRLAAIQKRTRPPQTGLGPNTKRTEEQIRLIRSRWNDGRSMGSIAREFSVTVTTVSNVVYRKLWAWVSD